MTVKLNTVGDALALIEKSSEVYISHAVDDPNEDDCIFVGNVSDVPYWVTCLPLECFDGDEPHVFYSLMCGIGEVSPVGILCKIPDGIERGGA